MLPNINIAQYDDFRIMSVIFIENTNFRSVLYHRIFVFHYKILILTFVTEDYNKALSDEPEYIFKLKKGLTKRLTCIKYVRKKTTFSKHDFCASKCINLKVFFYKPIKYVLEI